MIYDLLIKNAKIVNHDVINESDVLVHNGLIIKIEKNINDNAKKIINAQGQYLLPGAIDAHTHMEMPFGGTTSNDTYASGSQKGIDNGVTSFIDYAVQRKGESVVEAVEKRRELARIENTPGSVYFHCAITDLKNDKLLSELADLPSHGINSIKCYMVYRNENMMMSLADIKKILSVAYQAGVMVNVHAEDIDMLEHNVAELIKEGHSSPYYHYVSRNEEVESLADSHIIQLAKELQVPVYIVHLANKDGIKLVRNAKKKGVKVYAETCPQYLAFTNEVYKREDAINFICSPSIKGQDSQDELWKAISDGTIDVVATDHCPFKEIEKMWGKNDFRKVPNGCGGISVLYRYMLSEALKRDIPLTRIVELVSYNPSYIFKLNHKGIIKVGYDADLVLFNPHKTYVVKKDSNDDSNIYAQMTFLGDLKTISYNKRN